MLKMVKLAIAPESSLPGSPAGESLKREGMSKGRRSSVWVQMGK